MTVDTDSLLRMPREKSYVGPFELGPELGRGGMGVVYKAHDPRLNRRVALKLLQMQSAWDDIDVRRFEIECQSLASLDHPNIVRVYEWGQHNRQPYLAMKYMRGGTLTTRMASMVADRSRLWSPREAVQTLLPVIAAVGYTHRRGIIHRDLKPGNILFDEHGRPAVGDFGLAKRLDGVGLTRTGTVMGSPSYMSPEQARGEKGITTAADIWALGVILYESLTLQKPFAGRTTAETLMQIPYHEPTEPAELNPRVNADLSAVVMKCLAKRPGKRYRSAEALAADLERWLVGKPVTAKPPGEWEANWRWVQRHPTQAAGVLGAVMVLVLLTFVVVVDQLQEIQADGLEKQYLAEVKRNQQTWQRLERLKLSVAKAEHGRRVEDAVLEGRYAVLRERRAAAERAAAKRAAAERAAAERAAAERAAAARAAAEAKRLADEQPVETVKRIISQHRENQGTVTYLDLADTKVTDAGLKELAGLKSLTTLYLGGTPVTDAGLKELAGLTSLTTLDLSKTQVTDAGLKELAGLKSLTTLVLYGTKVTDAGVAELKQALPKCHIHK